MTRPLSSCSYCEIEDEGGAALASALEENSTLTELMCVSGGMG